MGGGLALHSGFHLNPDLAGIFACSSFLSDDSAVFDTLKTRKTQTDSGHLPKLLMFHGSSDFFVHMAWGRETFDELTQFGVEGEFKALENTAHELNASELHEIRRWILKQLPPLRSDVLLLT